MHKLMGGLVFSSLWGRSMRGEMLSHRFHLLRNHQTIGKAATPNSSV